MELIWRRNYGRWKGNVQITYLQGILSFLLRIVCHIFHISPLHILPIFSFGKKFLYCFPFLSFPAIFLRLLSSLFCRCGIFASSSKNLVRISTGVLVSFVEHSVIFFSLPHEYVGRSITVGHRLLFPRIPLFIVP